MDPFIGSEAVASGALTPGQLRWNYVAVHPNVYLAKDQDRTLLTNTRAAWLWTGRKGIVAGRAAAGLHGAPTVDDSIPVELIAGHSRRRRGIVVRSERIEDDEIQPFGSFRMTTAARTALDLGRRLPRDVAVRHLDELARVAGVSYAAVAELLDRYRGASGIAQARTALRLMDGGSESADETRLRLILVDAGLPRPRTRIVVGEGFDTAVIGMGWDEVKVGVGMYDGSSRDGCAAVQHTQRQDVVQRSGWIEIQVADLKRSPSILYRVRDALRTRGLRV
jgi:hypothetical protein